MKQAFISAPFLRDILSLARRALSRTAPAKAYVIATIVAIGLLLAPMAWNDVPAAGSPSAETGPTLLMDLGFFLGGALRLCGILVLAWVSLHVLKAYQSHLTQRRQSTLRVIDSLSLASQRSLYLVQLGDRQLLLGVTPNQISLLGETPANVVPEDASFADVFSTRVPHVASTPPPHPRRNGRLRSATARRILGDNRRRRHGPRTKDL